MRRAVKRNLNRCDRSRRKSAERQRSGATLVELAAILPVLFLIIFGIVEFSRVVMVQHTLAEGVRMAAREASLPTVFSASDVETHLRDYISGSVPAANATSSTVTVTVTPSDLNGMTSGDPVSVQVTVNYSDVSWLPSNGFRSVNGNTVMVAEATLERE